MEMLRLYPPWGEQSTLNNFGKACEKIDDFYTLQSL